MWKIRTKKTPNINAFHVVSKFVSQCRSNGETMTTPARRESVPSKVKCKYLVISCKSSLDSNLPKPFMVSYS